jgi:hypothetical protein
MKKQYLIDMYQCGNAIRLYFGPNVDSITGDDWSDRPYESNCGIVYSEFVDCYIDVCIPFHWNVRDHTDDRVYENTKLCRNDFKGGIIPLFWCISNNGERDNVFFYMGETEENIIDKLNKLGANTKIVKRR